MFNYFLPKRGKCVKCDRNECFRQIKIQNLMQNKKNESFFDISLFCWFFDHFWKTFRKFLWMLFFDFKRNESTKCIKSGRKCKNVQIRNGNQNGNTFVLSCAQCVVGCCRYYSIEDVWNYFWNFAFFRWCCN